MGVEAVPHITQPCVLKATSCDVGKALPNLPHPKPMQPSTFQSRPISEALTVSSLYSQPSPELDEVPTFESELFLKGEVSPPDTPNVTGQDQVIMRASPDVSPVSATPSPTASPVPALSSSGSKRYASNLPLPKSTTKKFWKLPNSAKGSEDPESCNVRWDEYSGEPTAGDRGKPPSATPGSVKLRETSGPLRLRPNFGTSTIITSNNVPPRKRVGNREVADAPIIIRPEWKGAGGRHSIVKPMFDRPLDSQQPRELPVGTHTRLAQSHEKEWGEIEISSASQLLPDDRDRDQQPAHLTIRTRNQDRPTHDQREREREQQHRLARVRIEKAKREREKILHAQEENERRAKERTDRVPVSSVPDPSNIEPNPSSTIQAHLLSDPCLSTPSEPETLTNGQGSPTAKSTDSDSPGRTLLNLYNPKRSWDQHTNQIKDQSFSGTMDHHCGLDQPQREAIQNSGTSPPKIPDPSMPGNAMRGMLRSQVGKRLESPEDARDRNSPPVQDPNHSSGNDQLRSRFSATTIATTAYDISPPGTPETTLDSPGYVESPDPILNRRRPVPPAGFIRRKPAPTLLGTPNSMPREEVKRLPKLPAEADATNPIETLQAKVDVLRRRRRNLERVIKELSNVVQPSSIAYDRKSRTEVKKTLSSLEKELAEVTKDEHDTGLKLLRAWKRHDDFAAFEPTMIWVRRVTH